MLERYADVIPGSGRRTAKEAPLEGPAAVLRICHPTGFSGTLSAASEGRRVTVGFRDGAVVTADSDGEGGDQAVFEFLSWSRGRLQTTPGEPGSGTPLTRGPGWAARRGG